MPAEPDRRLVLITRPPPGGEALRRALARRGWKAVVSAAQRIALLDPPPLPASAPGLVVLTSANAARAAARAGLGARLAATPLAVVGQATAHAARKAGFAGPILCIRPTAQSLLEALLACPAPQDETLYLTGATPRLDVARALRRHHRSAHTLTLYRAKDAKALTARASHALNQGWVYAVPFFSPAAGAAFARLAHATLPENATRNVYAFAIAAAAAQALRRLPWRSVRIAKTPDLTGMLNLFPKLLASSANAKV